MFYLNPNALTSHVRKTLTLFKSVYKKVKVPPLQATKALRAGRGIAVHNFIPLYWWWGGGSVPRYGRFTPRERPRYPLYRRLGGPQGRSGRVGKISPPTGIRSADRPARSVVAVPTELSRQPNLSVSFWIFLRCVANTRFRNQRFSLQEIRMGWIKRCTETNG